jgi:hypothetical protein
MRPPSVTMASMKYIQPIILFTSLYFAVLFLCGFLNFAVFGYVVPDIDGLEASNLFAVVVAANWIAYSDRGKRALVAAQWHDKAAIRLATWTLIFPLVLVLALLALFFVVGLSEIGDAIVTTWRAAPYTTMVTLCVGRLVNAIAVFLVVYRANHSSRNVEPA